MGHFDFFFKQKKTFLLHLNENKQPVHMSYHLFLHYGWFLQNLGKDFIRANMHTTEYGLEGCRLVDSANRVYQNQSTMPQTSFLVGTFLPFLTARWL